MLQATGYPAEIADFYSAISAGYWGVFLVAKTVQLVMCENIVSLSQTLCLAQESSSVTFYPSASDVWRLSSGQMPIIWDKLNYK